MKVKTPGILVVDDDASILAVLEARLASAGYVVLTASCAEDGLDVLRGNAVDLVVTDLKMPGMGGRAFLHEVKESWPDLPVIILTAYGTIPDAVASIHKGAADYLSKPFDGKELVAKIRNLLHTDPGGEARGKPRPATKSGKGGTGGGKGTKVSDILWGGRSPAMQELYDLVERVAPSDVNVLILGESGTGKEMVARVIHELSPRREKPLVVVDCGSTPATLLESELFGHVKGSFTHAVKDKKGLIEEADTGTLFLDEIGNISQEMQTRLLRFLEERTIRRVGDTKSRNVDCRVLAATNADLAQLVREGDFREDLYFRLKVVTIHIPPLRDRVEDIPLLAERFLAQTCERQGCETPSLSRETMDILLSHPWPGNVRELKNSLEAGAVLCRDGILEPRDLQLQQGVDVPSGENGNGTPLSLDDSEREAIIKALEHTGWVQTRAADLLGISRRAIHYKIKKYGIEIPRRG